MTREAGASSEFNRQWLLVRLQGLLFQIKLGYSESATPSDRFLPLISEANTRPPLLKLKLVTPS